MGKFVDSVIAYRILKLLVTPFNKTDAFKLGIIDDKGNELIKMQDLNTVQERDAYTLLHRLVYRLKKIIEKVPIANKQLVSLAAAYALIKEALADGKEPIDLEFKYINIVALLHFDGSWARLRSLAFQKDFPNNQLYSFGFLMIDLGFVAPDCYAWRVLEH